MRQHCRELRALLAAHSRPQTAFALAAHFTAHPAFHTSRRIACYYPHRTEMNTHALIEKIWEAGKQCYLPVQTAADTLVFGLYQAGDVLKKNALGIREPTAGVVLEADQLDMILLPLLAFDLKGHRLGSGGGFYDRTLAFILRSQAKTRVPHLAGVAYAAQAVEALPVDPWDVSLNSVITERGCQFF